VKFLLVLSRCVSDVRAVFLTSQRNFDENTRVLSWGAKKLFVRQSYEAIATRILESSAALVSRDSHYVYGLFGSPGTGKTYFVYYFLDRLIREKPKCLVV
jgi:Cdc6-like AAA superfamily ATPase